MRPLSILGGFFALAGLGSAASTNSSSTTGSKTCNSYLCIQTLLDSSSNTLTYTLTTPGSPLGWYGIGTGSKMSGSTMWVVWSSGGTINWSERDGHGHDAPNVASSNTATYLTAQSMSNSSGLQATWTVPYSGSADSSYPLIWARSGKTPGSSSSASIQQHSQYGNFVMDLTQSVASNGTVASTANGSSEKYERLIKIHAILMAVGWGILAPFAVLLARFGRATTFKWVAAHQWIQIVGTTGFTLAGFGLAVAAVAANDESHFRGGHQKLGLAITILIFLQLFGGWWIHHKYNAQRTRRPVTNWLHMVIGMAFLIAGFFAMYTGIDTWDEGKTWMKILFWVWAVIMVLAILAGYAMIPRQRRREAAKKEAAMGLNPTNAPNSHAYPPVNTSNAYGAPPTQYGAYPPANQYNQIPPPASYNTSYESVGPGVKPPSHGQY